MTTSTYRIFSYMPSPPSSRLMGGDSGGVIYLAKPKHFVRREFDIDQGMPSRRAMTVRQFPRGLSPMWSHPAPSPMSSQRTPLPMVSQWPPCSTPMSLNRLNGWDALSSGSIVRLKPLRRRRRPYPESPPPKPSDISIWSQKIDHWRRSKVYSGSLHGFSLRTQLM